MTVLSLILLLSIATTTTITKAHRILHEPLYPIQWNPLPPPLEIDFSPPPRPLTISPSDHSTPTKKILVVALVVVAFSLLALSAFLLYLRHRRPRPSPDSGKLIAGETRSAPRSQPEFLHLGTVGSAPAITAGRRRSSSGELIGSPYRKLEKERVLEIDPHASPEIQPLAPLRTVLRSRSVPAPVPAPAAVESDDDETFYTSKRSLASVTTGSPESPPARRPSPPPAPPPFPKSRRSLSRMRLSAGSNSELEQIIPAMASRQLPPPPPPPPPLPMKIGRITEMSRASLRPLPAVAAKESEEEQPSRRRLLKPLPAEGILTSRPVVGDVEVGNGVESSSKTEIENFDGEVKTKLKPLHWDKVRASSDRATVWDQFKSSSFQVNEDMIEALFVNNAGNAAVPKDGNRRYNFQQMRQENRVLDPKKAQNIAILLRALNVTTEEVSEALLDGNSEAVGAELLETLVNMAPTKEEELRLRDYSGQVSKLGSPERFLKTILDIPFAFKRVDAMLYRANFDTEVKYLMKSFETLEAACEDLRSSRLFLKLLEAVLTTGNRMNVGTSRGQAKAFKLDTLLKLADIKGTDGKTTLLHFVVQEIIRSEGAGNGAKPTSENHSITNREEQFKQQGLKVVAGLSNELGNVRKAAAMDSDVLSSYVSKLEAGLQKIKSILQLDKSCTKGMKFFDTMKNFLKDAEMDIGRVKEEEKRALLLVKDITEYFHGNTAKEEAHPFRIFMVVRDFLSMLDNVCKEVGIIHDRTTMEPGPSFRIAPSASLPVLQKYVLMRRDAIASSDYDSSSS